MKTSFTLDLKVFSLILKELRIIKREIRNMKSGASAAAKPRPAREIKDKVYSADVLKKLKITTATLIRYEKMGLIKYHKEGVKKVYSEAEILAFKKMKGKTKRIGKNFSAVS